MNDRFIAHAVNNVPMRVVQALFALVFLDLGPSVGAQSAQDKRSRPAEWPLTSPYDAAICAFDKALTKAARDANYRSRLTSSVDSAREAVAELGNIHIPNDRVMVFFEAKGSVTRLANYRPISTSSCRSNEKYHVFFLPPFNPSDTTTEYRYEGFFMGHYDQWIRTTSACPISP